MTRTLNIRRKLLFFLCLKSGSPKDHHETISNAKAKNHYCKLTQVLPSVSKAVAALTTAALIGTAKERHPLSSKNRGFI